MPTQHNLPSVRIGIYSLSLFLILALPLAGFASDEIFLHSGQKFECKVLEIDTSTVKIEILESGIKRTFYKYEIKVILYEKGNVETFPIVKPNPVPEKEERLDELEKRTLELQLKEARQSGVTTGVAVCCVILFVLLVL